MLLYRFDGGAWKSGQAAARPRSAGKPAFFQAGHKKKASGLLFPSRFWVRPSASLHLLLCPLPYVIFKSLERGSCVVRPDCARHFAEFSFLPPPKARIPTLLPSPSFLLFFFKLSSVALGCFSTFSSHVSIIRSVALLLLSCLAAMCWALLWCSPGARRARSLLAWSHTPSQAASEFRSCRSRLSEVL